MNLQRNCEKRKPQKIKDFSSVSSSNELIDLKFSSACRTDFAAVNRVLNRTYVVFTFHVCKTYKYIVIHILKFVVLLLFCLLLFLLFLFGWPRFTSDRIHSGNFVKNDNSEHKFTYSVCVFFFNSTNTFKLDDTNWYQE